VALGRGQVADHVDGEHPTEARRQPHPIGASGLDGDPSPQVFGGGQPGQQDGSQDRRRFDGNDFAVGNGVSDQEGAQPGPGPEIENRSLLRCSQT
jgi:hypothetical protein